jgi:hypothetical protein
MARVDDSFPSHPGRAVFFPTARILERQITEESIQQYTGAAALGDFSSLLNELLDSATDKVRFSWAWSGSSTATFNIYVSVDGSNFVLDGTAGAGATHYDYTSTFDITENHADTPFTIGFCVEAVVGRTMGRRSVNVSSGYYHA